MKTVLAQGRKDLVSHAVLLWVWAVCVGIDGLCFLDRIPFHPDLASGTSAVVLSGSIVGGLTIAVAAFATQALLAIILLIRIVQADLLTDSSAFWRTRPIARHELLLEKALFAALFVVGGFLAGWAVHFGSPLASGGRVLLSTLVFVSGLFAFAAVTADLSKFIIVFLGLAWGALIVAGILLALLKYLAMSAGISTSYWPLAASSFFPGEYGHLVLSAFYLVAFLGIVVFQYLTLRTRISRQLLFATFFVASVLQGSRGHIEFHSQSTTHVRGP
jgi:hypothetical protein